MLIERFFLKFLLDTCPFLGPLIPLFGTSGDISSGFQSQSGFCLIRTLWRHMWYTFPEIHLSRNTSAGVYSQHSSQSLSPHVCFSRGRMPDLNHRPPAWQGDALTTRPQRPSSDWKTLLLKFWLKWLSRGSISSFFVCKVWLESYHFDTKRTCLKC